MKFGRVVKLLGRCGMNRKILVTGGNGFIGSHVVRQLLSQGDKPILLIRETSDMWRLKNILNNLKVFNINEQQLSEVFESEDLSGVINLATYYRKHSVFEDIDKMIYSNVTFPSQILHLCKENNVPTFITAGSYFQYRASSFLSDINSDIPRDLYAATKSALLKIMDYYAAGSNLNSIELILFTPYGPMDHDEKLIPYIIQNALSGKSLNLTSGFQKLNLVYVGDVAKAFLQALDYPKNSETTVRLNVANTCSYSIRDIITVMEEIFQKHIDVNWSSILTNEIDKEYSLDVDSQKIEEDLKWKPKFNIYKGLKRTIEYYKGNLDGN